VVKPTGTHIVVCRDDNTAPTDLPDRFAKDGKIIIPEKFKSKSKEATVLAIGKDVQEDIRVGDRVAITWHDGTKFTDKHFGEIEILYETEVLAVLGRS